jgi:hypothetical protein
MTIFKRWWNSPQKMVSWRLLSRNHQQQILFRIAQLGPALDHYIYYPVHITKTKCTRIVDTVEFFPSKTAMQHTSSKDMARIAALELSNALQNPAPAAPFSHIGTSQLHALRQLSDIFSAALPSGTAQNAPPVAQTSSQFRSNVPPVHIPEAAPPACKSRLSHKLQASLHTFSGIHLRG